VALQISSGPGILDDEKAHAPVFCIWML
jgi:hypothetical protein